LIRQGISEDILYLFSVFEAALNDGKNNGGTKRAAPGFVLRSEVYTPRMHAKRGQYPQEQKILF
jgi:hypothetical protein